MISKGVCSKIETIQFIIIGALLIFGMNPVSGQQGGPTAAIAGEPLEVGVNDDLTLDGSPSSGSDECPLIDYWWELDGDFDYDDAFGSVASFSWDTTGIYGIILVVFDACGDFDAYQTTVTVTDGSIGGSGDPIEVCGNGIVESGEECDDGNLANGDGCDSSCMDEPAQVPEFPAASLPALMAIGGYLLMKMRKRD